MPCSMSVLRVMLLRVMPLCVLLLVYCCSIFFCFLCDNRFNWLVPETRSLTFEEIQREENPNDEK